MKVLKKIWSVVSTILVALTVLCALFLMGSRLCGYEVRTVLTGSMRPTYSEGDLLFIKRTDGSGVKVGDPVTFQLNEEGVVATHRVVRIDAEKQHVYTKGDANSVEDGEPVHFKNVIGVPQFSVPLIGYFANYIQNPPGMYIALAVGAVLVILVFLPDMLNKKQAPAPEAAPEAPEIPGSKGE